jgi:hypothetical protein
VRPFGKEVAEWFDARVSLLLLGSFMHGSVEFRARPMAQFRCSVTFSAIVLAKGMVWLSAANTCAVANSCLA